MRIVMDVEKIRWDADSNEEMTIGRNEGDAEWGGRLIILTQAYYHHHYLHHKLHL